MLVKITTPDRHSYTIELDTDIDLDFDAENAMAALQRAGITVDTDGCIDRGVLRDQEGFRVAWIDAA